MGFGSEHIFGWSSATQLEITEEIFIRWLIALYVHWIQEGRKYKLEISMEKVLRLIKCLPESMKLKFMTLSGTQKVITKVNHNYVHPL